MSRLLIIVGLFSFLIACSNKEEQTDGVSEAGTETPKLPSFEVDMDVEENSKITSMTSEGIVLEDGEKIDFPMDELQEAVTIIFVPNAEKMDNQPFLSPEGKARVERLNEVLGVAPIKRAYVFDEPSLKTGAALAKKIGCPISTYKGDKKEPLLKTIIGNFKGEKVLLIGRDRTLQGILSRLTGESYYQMYPEFGHDEVFIAFVKEFGVADVRHVKY